MGKLLQGQSVTEATPVATAVPLTCPLARACSPLSIRQAIARRGSLSKQPPHGPPAASGTNDDAGALAEAPRYPRYRRKCQCFTMLRPLQTRILQSYRSGNSTTRRLISSTMAPQRIANPALFVCDLQEKFRPAIYEFPKVVATTQKLLRASMPPSAIESLRGRTPAVFATTQNKARLGETCPELQLDAPEGVQTLVHADKTLFSMITPEVQKALDPLRANGPISAIIVGIESHICVTQTTTDLLRSGHKVYVIADGVSSCNKEEVPIALARLRHEGAIVTTSESLIYEAVGDAGTPEFKHIIKVVKDTSANTKESLQTLCKI
ncbi:hypothetical protein OPT61_g8323 [Boeremia exigua]|uniref:Uncharacterized protein n=1 Tax=Boeremia exigua TaxID=749465 RepID=A0ACC2HZU5_9PLEO|nr:hypothetical protein OPT61_g8323 [Boeremia exigua]